MVLTRLRVIKMPAVPHRLFRSQLKNMSSNASKLYYIIEEDDNSMHVASGSCSEPFCVDNVIDLSKYRFVRLLGSRELPVFKIKTF